MWGISVKNVGTISEFYAGLRNSPQILFLLSAQCCHGATLSIDKLKA